MSIAWIFPGQGSQRVGMGRELAERYASAARAFDEANDAVGFDLRRLCFEGPAEELQRTANAQPALLATSIAALRAAEESLGGLATPVCVAGHSLGEFTALVAAGVLSYGDGLRLVRRRGELMQAADPAGGMAAVLGLDADAVARAIEGTGCVVANDNAPGQVVISGPKAGLAKAEAALVAAGAKRVVPLRVSAAFHAPAMRPVALTLGLEMRTLAFRDARVPVICNVDGAARTRGSDFPEVLARQVYSPVRWVAVVKRMQEGERVVRFVEFGAGNVLTGLVKRIAPDAATANVQDPRSLEEAAPVLR